jgi:hypothetical protein
LQQFLARTETGFDDIQLNNIQATQSIQQHLILDITEKDYDHDLEIEFLLYSCDYPTAVKQTNR